jgi:CHAD domain-containing protein
VITLRHTGLEVQGQLADVAACLALPEGNSPLDSGNASAPQFEPLPLSNPTMAKAGGLPLPVPLRALPEPSRRPQAAGPFLAAALRQRWDTYRAALRVCQKDFSERTVHELRVASRRLIAQLVMVGCVGAGTTGDKAHRVLKRRLKALGQLRDTHVQRLFVEQQVARFPELILVRDFLRRQERRLERAAAAKVRGFKTRKLRKWILALERRLNRPLAPTGRPDRLASAVARATAKAFADVVRCRCAIKPAEADTIHRTRIAFKKFRYMVESLSPDFTGLSKRDLRALAHYQRRMGILQDLEVVQQSLSGFARKHPQTAGLLEPFVRHLRARRVRALRSFLGSADELYLFWPPGRARSNAAPAAARDAA